VVESRAVESRAVESRITVASHRAIQRGLDARASGLSEFE
jgi:hypothetical protein